MDENKDTNNHKKIKDIAFVGVMVPHKGSKILKDIIKNKHKNIRIHLFGSTDDNSLKKNKSNYIYHGRYNREELPNLLVKNNIKLACIFSTIPETYSYTLTETFMAKIPVISFDIGAVAERIKKDDLGWVIDLNLKTKDIYKEIDKILNNEELLNKKKNNFKKYNIKTTEQMQNEYEKIYKEHIKNEKHELVNTYPIIEIQKKNEGYKIEVIEAIYGKLIRTYERIRATLLWRIAKKIRRKLREIRK